MQRAIATRFRFFYGSHPLHLLAVLASFALVGYVISVAGPATLWNPTVWWQSILVWFLAAALLHDLVLFPLYALADRSLTAGLHALRHRRGPHRTPQVSLVTYVRVPVLASGLLLLIFLPGIIEQGSDNYLAATGQTQEPFLGRWLLLTTIICAASALTYAARTGYARRRAGASPAEEARVGAQEAHRAEPQA